MPKGTGQGPEPSSTLTFAGAVDVLKAHTDVVILSSGDAQIAVVPQYQGRVMTSTALGPGGPSLGWVNLDLVASGRHLAQINPFGGEDRFWLGPEGGQFSLFFAPDAPFVFERWATPAVIDTEAWPLIDRGESHLTFRHTMQLTNRARTTFDLRVDRTIRLLDRDAIAQHLGRPVAADMAVVGFESENTITNTGTRAWTKETGLVSIWILGMFAPSERTTLVIPLAATQTPDGQSVLNDVYFGKVPPQRLRMDARAVYFRGDGRERGKIGIARAGARPGLGSYDPAAGVLTIAQFTLPDDAVDYTNGMWEMQQHPFAGDVVNSYNDGPTPAGAPLGPFYELESSSPAAALAPGESLTHIHRTIHLQGPPSSLDAIARANFGVDLDTIVNALP